MKRTLSVPTCAIGVAVLAAVAFNTRATEEPARTAGPYVPTPQAIVDRMLQMAQVGPKDLVVDLGSGDGRLVRTAAKVYGASGFGVDIDAELVERSNAAAKREGIANRVSFIQQDVFKADVRKATVVTLYVLPEMMVNLRPKLLSELRPGTRIVSHDYHFREWMPDNRDTFDVPEKKEAVGFSHASVYLWIVPATVGGRWRLDVPGAKLGEAVTLELNQLFQNVNGQVRVGARSADIANLKLRADAIEFALDATAQPKGVRHVFRGRVNGDTMEGHVDWGTNASAKRYEWKATRIQAPAEAIAK